MGRAGKGSTKERCSEGGDWKKTSMDTTASRYGGTKRGESGRSFVIGEDESNKFKTERDMRKANKKEKEGESQRFLAGEREDVPTVVARWRT